MQAKGVLFNNKPAEKTGNKVPEKEKEKEKDNKEKDSKEKDNKDSKEKDSKEKPKPDKEKEKEKEKKTTPKPRLSVGAAAVSTEQSPKSDSSASSSSNQPGTPKQRGRKPSIVKTPTESPSSSKTTPETQKPPSLPGNSPGQSPLPGLVPLPAAVPAVQTSTSLLTTPIKDTASVPACVLVPEMLPKSVASQLQEMPQPSTSVLLPEIAKQMDVDVLAPTTLPKQTPKQTATGNTTKKRAAPKASDEPKRKVGRPPIKKKPDTPLGVRKNGAHTSSSNTVTSPLNTAFPSTFPQVSQGTPTSMPAFATFSNQNMFTGNSQGSSVPQNGPRTPSPNAYMIPQPRNRGLLENGHVQRPNNTSQAPL